jgi:hypothetical protein
MFFGTTVKFSECEHGEWPKYLSRQTAVLGNPNVFIMPDIPSFRNLSLERYGDVFVITLQKPPENRLNSWFCQELIRAFRTVQNILGPDAEGAVITRGAGDKFWCTVCFRFK